MESERRLATTQGKDIQEPTVQVKSLLRMNNGFDTLLAVSTRGQAGSSSDERHWSALPDIVHMLTTRLHRASIAISPDRVGHVALTPCGRERAMHHVRRLFRGTPMTGSHLVEMRPKPFLDGLRGLEPSPIVKLIRIIALVEELLAAVTFIANVDVIAFGE